MDKRDKFKEYYRQANSARKLPWHHAEPNRFLDAIIAACAEPGTALDMGCGSGVDSVYLARAGWQVTALDFMQEALDMARAAAEEAGVAVELVQADVIEWNTDRQFDLLLDSGLLHNLSRDNIPAYRKRILAWLSANGDFVLAHWESRTDADRLRGGARRVTREQITDLFAPELEEQQFERLEATGLPETVGPDLSVGFYRFKHR
jgi:cyclopropane fatty-acyl-phospholipid synthase-like methyltransferase